MVVDYAEYAEELQWNATSSGRTVDQVGPQSYHK